jgi:hypothetical protein
MPPIRRPAPTRNHIAELWDGLPLTDLLTALLLTWSYADFQVWVIV